MTTTQVIAKAQESLNHAALAAKDSGVMQWETKRHNSVVAIVLVNCLAKGWQPTAADMFAFISATYNQSAWRQKFEKEGIFSKGRKSADNDIAALMAEGIGE